MKETLEKKKEELTASLEKIQNQMAQLQEQAVMHRGALQYNQILMDELDAAEKAKESPVKAVE